MSNLINYDTIAAETFPYPAKPKKRNVTDEELWILSYYRSSELSGALLMGKLARRTKDAELRARLTWHFAEEARHALRWTEIIRMLGADPLLITETYQSNYFAAAGIPKDDLEFLAITQVFEKRVAYHFTLHSRMPGVHPLIRRMLAVMTRDEGPHISWVRAKLDACERSGKGMRVKKMLDRYTKIDKKVYIKEAEKFVRMGWRIPEEAWAELRKL